MGNEEKPKYWIDRAYAYLEANYERFDGRINLGFYVAIGALTTVWSLFVSGAVSYMNTAAGIIFGVSFWATIILGSLIVRNSSKTQVSSKLTNIETKIDQMSTNINALIDSQKKLIDRIDASIESQQKLVDRLIDRTDKLIEKKQVDNGK